MPIFEYECVRCGASFEKLVRRPGRGDEVTCPSCRAADVRRKVSMFGAVTGSTPSFDVSPAACGPTGGG